MRAGPLIGSLAQRLSAVIVAMKDQADGQDGPVRAAGT
jgi:hypothetical protein